MSNYSQNKEEISLNVETVYYVIDALYINAIKRRINSIDMGAVEQELKQKVFPYTKAPFAKFTNRFKKFNINCIKKISYNKLDLSSKSRLVVDSGILLFIEEEVFISFCNNFDFDLLVASDSEFIEVRYWNNLEATYPSRSIALISSPGVNSDCEFDGSGTYEIDMH